MRYTVCRLRFVALANRDDVGALAESAVKSTAELSAVKARTHKYLARDRKTGQPPCW
jgi:hypothetical protein